MALSKSTLTKFVKATNDTNKNTQKETTVYGTISSYDPTNKVCYVKLDGADNDIPVTRYTATVNAGERVIVMIKNHTAVITGNLKSPSAGETYVNQAVQGSIVVADQAFVDGLWSDYFE
jgi:hypothetical protein